MHVRNVVARVPDEKSSRVYNSQELHPIQDRSLKRLIYKPTSGMNKVASMSLKWCLFDKTEQTERERERNL